MATTIHPVDATAGTPSYSGRMLRQVGSVAYAGATAARPFGVLSGVRPGTSPTTVTATATVWTVNAHAGLLDFEAAMESGPTPYAIDAAVTGAVRAADAFARVDLIWIRQDIPLEDGASVPAAVPGYTYGTVASTPPATPARCMVIAWINVPASGGGSPSVTWKAPYLAAAGGIMDGNVDKVRTLAPALSGAFTTSDLVADQTILAGQYPTTKYVLRVAASIQSVIAAAGGARLEVLVDGTVVKSCTFGNGGTGAANTAFSVNWSGTLTVAASHTTRARIVSVAGANTVTADLGQTFVMSIAPATDF